MTHTLTQIPLSDLHPSKFNVRKHGEKDIASLAASIRAIGLLQPLIVRADATGYEIAGGERRFRALSKIARDCESMEPVPCIVLADTEDATLIEASLAENIERLPMDEMDQYAAFAALIKAGRSEDEIAERFGVTPLVVRRRLSLARLIPDIHRLYRAGEIEAETLKLLTLATRERQKAYVALLRDPEQSPPPHWQLKAWLLGGAELSTKAALFDESLYTGDISGDLFGDQRYFTDAEQFWRLQNEAIAAMQEDFLAKGWSEVEVIGPDQRFEVWKYEPCTKANGGHIVIEVGANGAVEIHKGVLSRDEAQASRRKGKRDGKAPKAEAAGPDKAGRPELSEPLANYCDLVRLALVRNALAAEPMTAVRVLLALMLGGGTHVRLAPEPMTPRSETAAAMLKTLPAMATSAEAEAKATTALGLDEGSALIGAGDTASLYDRLKGLSDEAVLALLALVTSRVLALGTGFVDALGADLNVSIESAWQPDAAFLDLVRDREVVSALLQDVIGKKAAAGYLTDTGKAQKAVILSALEGKARPKVEGWVPRWLAFPAKGYTKRPRTAHEPATA